LDRNRIVKFFLMMVALMGASQYFLANRGNINMLPAVIIVYVFMTFALKTSKDHIFNIFIAYAMSHFHFAVKAGTLGPWLILGYLLLGGWRFLYGKFFSKNAPLIFQIMIFIFVNLLGLMIKNPNGSIENTSSFISLIGLMVALLATSNHDFNKSDVAFGLFVFGIMTAYSLVSSLNTGLDIVRTSSPLLVLSEIYFGTGFGVSMFGRSCAEHFLVMNMFFANLINVNTKNLLGIKKFYVSISFFVSFIGCLAGFSKTTTVLLLAGNVLIFLRFKTLFNARNAARLVVGIVLLVSVLAVVQHFFNFYYIFERFQAQPEIFKSVYENPISAAGTSRDESFYWGLRRNVDFNWILGYGWSPADDNHAAYFENLTINIRKQDFHSLYFSVFPVFGWIGGSIFLIWLFIAVVKSYRMAHYKGMMAKVLGPAFLGLMVSFLLSEYSIPITSESNYMFILMIWLGMINALYSSYRQFNYIPKPI